MIATNGNIWVYYQSYLVLNQPIYPIAVDISGLPPIHLHGAKIKVSHHCDYGASLQATHRVDGSDNLIILCFAVQM